MNHIVGRPRDWGVEADHHLNERVTGVVRHHSDMAVAVVVSSVKSVQVTCEERCVQVKEAQNRSATFGNDSLVVAQAVSLPSDTTVAAPVDRQLLGRTWGAS